MVLEPIKVAHPESIFNDTTIEEFLALDNQTIINVLIQSYAENICAGDTQEAWKKFNDAFVEQTGKNLSRRNKVIGEPASRLLTNYMTDKEARDGLKIAVKICEDAGMKICEDSEGEQE